MTLEEALQLAMRSFESGQLDQAAQIAQQIVAQVPQCDRAWQVIGGVAYRRGDWYAAEQALQSALMISPGNLDYQDNLAAALNALERFGEAESLARDITQRDPDRTSGWNALGLALKGLHRWSESENAFREALKRQPRFVQALNNLSNVLRLQGRAIEAEQAARETLALKPGLVEALVNLGTALHEQQRYDEAIAAFDEALRLRPSLAVAAFNRGIALEHADRLSEAERSYQHALELQSQWPQGLNNLGVVLKAQGRLDEALAVFDAALAIKPNYMVAHTNRLACLQCRFETPSEEILAAHREWDERHAQPLRVSANESLGDGSSGRRLRVGFVSPDFGIHPVGRFLIGIFEKLPRDEIETFCYSDRKQLDAMTSRFQDAAAHWIDVRSLTDDALAERIRRDDLDLLIDLTGHTGHHRLLVFARKPAPVQATWIGYPGTTGMSAIDWIMADGVLIPPECDRYYSERVMRLPRTSICYEPPEFARDLKPTRSPCERTGVVTFGSFNKLDKTTPDVLRVWCEILRRVPDSRLVLRNKGLDDPAVRTRFMSLLVRDGVSPERIQLHGWCSHEALLASYADIDIGLDTFPFSGGATSADALWCGVPIVTLIGETFASRQTASMLLTMKVASGVEQCIESYSSRAVEMAADRSALSEKRRRIFDAIRQGPMSQPREVARDIATAFRTMAGWSC